MPEDALAPRRRGPRPVPPRRHVPLLRHRARRPGSAPPLDRLRVAPGPDLAVPTANLTSSIVPHPEGAIPKPPLHPAIKAMHVSRCSANYAWYLRDDEPGAFRCGGGSHKCACGAYEPQCVDDGTPSFSAFLEKWGLDDFEAFCRDDATWRAASDSRDARDGVANGGVAVTSQRGSRFGPQITDERPPFNSRRSQDHEREER